MFVQNRGVRTVTELSRSILYDSWRDLIKVFPNEAGTVRTLTRYLNANETITTGAIEEAPSVSPATVLGDEYATFLNKVRGCSPSTISHHRFASRCFLEHLESSSVALGSIHPRDIEAYVTQASKRMCRASLQHEVAAVRGLLRFLATDGRVRTGLDRQIDTPRLYRLEQLPHALPWDTVTTLLKSIDRKSGMGLVMSGQCMVELDKKALLDSNTELRAALILAGNKIRRGFGRHDPLLEILRRTLHNARRLKRANTETASGQQRKNLLD